jgi:hypothetical protein
LFTSSLLHRRHRFFFLALVLSGNTPCCAIACPLSESLIAQECQRRAQRNKLWAGLLPLSTDLKKVKKEGFMVEFAEIVFPSTEVIPTPPLGFRVMFLAFLLYCFSLPAHKFLRGLLFVYGMQLHQLTPNSLLHIAYFITLCEAFLGVDPHLVLWKYLFCLRPSGSKDEIPELGGAIDSL